MQPGGSRSGETYISTVPENARKCQWKQRETTGGIHL